VKSPESPEQEVTQSSDNGINNKNRKRGTLIALIAIFFFLYVGSETSFGGWIATYAKTLGLGDAVTAAYLTSAFWGALTLGRFLSVLLAVYIKPATMLVIDLAGTIISLCIVLAGSGSVIVTWIGTIGTGLFMASLFPATVNLAERRMTITGKITAWFFVGGSLGGMTLPLIIGQFFNSAGPLIAPAVMCASVVLAALVFTILMREANNTADIV
jgi:fucose permease